MIIWSGPGRRYPWWYASASGSGGAGAYLLLLLVVLYDLEDGRDVVAKVELLERSLDVLAGNRLLRVLFGDLVGLGGDEGDELDAALDQQVAGFLGEGHGLRIFVGGFGGENFVDDLLDRGCGECG